MFIWEDIITKIFVEIDDFCKILDKKIKHYFIEDKTKPKRNRKKRLTESEIMTILVAGQIFKFKTFKDFYLFLKQKTNYFPNAVSYNRFVELIKSVFIYFQTFLLFKLLKTKNNSKVYYIDSTSIKVCDNRRIYSHKVFKNAKRGKTSMGWFYGFKLHYIINENGELINFYFTPGNVDDRNENVIFSLISNLNPFSYLFGDKGYISKKLEQNLKKRDIILITKKRKNQKKENLSEYKKLLLSKRNIIESANNILKNFYELVHSRHRNNYNAYTHWLVVLTAYIFHPNKPKINIDNILQKKDNLLLVA